MSSTTLKEPKIAAVQFLGQEIERERLKTVALTSAGFLLALNVLGIPYLLPATRRFRGPPSINSKRIAVTRLFDELVHRNLIKPGSKFIDFGSGDGRIVFEAQKRGLTASGIELNPWLYGISRFKSLFKRGPSPNFTLGNMWSTGPSLLRTLNPDVIAVYGVPGEFLTKFSALVKETTPKDKTVIVVSNKYRLLQLREIGSVDTFWIYEIGDPQPVG